MRKVSPPSPGILPSFLMPAGSVLWFVRLYPGKKELKGAQADCLLQLLEWIACTHKSRWSYYNVDIFPNRVQSKLKKQHFV